MLGGPPRHCRRPLIQRASSQDPAAGRRSTQVCMRIYRPLSSPSVVVVILVPSLRSKGRGRASAPPRPTAASTIDA
jgi:hypothetical protein